MARVVRSPETVEHPGSVLRGDARTVVTHGDLAVRDGHVDRRPWRAVLRGVVQKIGDRAGDADLDAVDRRRRGRHVEVHLRIAEGNVIDHLVHDLVELKLLEGHRALLVARHLDKVADESGEALDLAHQIAEELPALEELEVRAQAGERRPQLMGRVGHQLTLRAERRLELTEHRVEARAEAAELVATVRGDTTRQVTRLRHLLDGRGETLHRCYRSAPDERAESGREEDRACRKGDEEEPRLSEGRIDPGSGWAEVLDNLDRASALDRNDVDREPRVLRIGGREERTALSARDVFDLLDDKSGVRGIEVGPEDRAGCGDDLCVHVRSSGHELRLRTEAPPPITGPWTTACRVLRGHYQVCFDLMHQLVLHHEVHRNGCPDRGDRDSGSREDRYPKAKAHGSFMT